MCLAVQGRGLGGFGQMVTGVGVGFVGVNERPDSSTFWCVTRRRTSLAQAHYFNCSRILAPSYPAAMPVPIKALLKIAFFSYMIFLLSSLRISRPAPSSLPPGAQESVDLFLCILSARQNVIRRRTLRATWLRDLQKISRTCCAA